MFTPLTLSAVRTNNHSLQLPFLLSAFGLPPPSHSRCHTYTSSHSQHHRTWFLPGADVVPDVRHATLLHLPAGHLPHALFRAHPLPWQPHRPQDLACSDDGVYPHPDDTNHRQWNAAGPWNIHLVRNDCPKKISCQLPHTQQFYFSAPGYDQDYYKAMYTRAQPYIYGILIGYILYKMRGRKLNILWVTFV